MLLQEMLHAIISIQYFLDLDPFLKDYVIGLEGIHIVKDYNFFAYY